MYIALEGKAPISQIEVIRLDIADDFLAKQNWPCWGRRTRYYLLYRYRQSSGWRVSHSGYSSLLKRRALTNDTFPG